MSLKDYLQKKLDTFYDSFITYIGSDVNDGYIAVRHNGKTLDAKVVSPLRAGKVLIVKTGESYFAVQDEEISRGATKVQEKIDIYQEDDEDEISVIIFVLSEKLPINIEYRDNYSEDKSLIPNIQIVEDIYVIDDRNIFKNLKKGDMRLDGNEAEVKEPYLTFFSYLTQTKYKSFYNYLTNTKTKKEGLGIGSFKLDDKETSRNKLNLFDYSFMFPDASIYSKFTVRTGVLKKIFFPYSMEEKADERPNKIATFEEVLLKFYSSVKDTVPSNALDWTYLRPKIKNMGILNMVFPDIVDYDYPFAVEVTDRTDKVREINYFQIANSNIAYDPLQILNYESVLIGSKGVLRYLSDGVYFQFIGDVSVKVLNVNIDSKDLEYEGVSNTKIKGNIKIENIESVEVDDVGLIIGKKGKSYFRKY